MRPSFDRPESTLVILFFTVVLLQGCVGGPFSQNHSQDAALLAAAKRLGYEPASRIAQVQRCWDILSHCGQQLFYETDLTQTEFARNLYALTWDITDQTSVDGYEIFTKLNLGTPSRITIGGRDALGDRTQLPLFNGYRWRLIDSADRSWTVDYYPLADQPGPFAINGQALKRNVVQILYQTR